MALLQAELKQIEEQARALIAPQRDGHEKIKGINNKTKRRQAEKKIERKGCAEDAQRLDGVGVQGLE